MSVAELASPVKPAFRGKGLLEAECPQGADVEDSLAVHTPAFPAGCARGAQTHQVFVERHGALPAVSCGNFYGNVVDEHRTTISCDAIRGVLGWRVEDAEI